MFFLAERSDLCWIVDVICKNPNIASGACHRSQQLLELLEAGGFTLTPIEPPPRPGSLRLALEGLATGLRDGFYKPWGPAALRNAGAQASTCRGLFARYPQARGLILEGTGYGAVTATAWCRRHGKRAILVPANIESLATYPPVWPYGRLPLLQRLQNELPWLRQADAIVTIAIEEAWLLELCGIPCQHLPYYPPRRHRARLQQLAAERRQRASASANASASASASASADNEPGIGYLFVADFGNAPNRTAAERLFAWLARQSEQAAPVHIAGRSSAKLEPLIAPALRDRVVLHGEVSDAELHALQRRCQALLILHPATSGMLTRIIDAAIAELPVVGDWMTFKSYHHSFRDGLLSEDDRLASPAVTVPPAEPRQAAARFLELLER